MIHNFFPGPATLPVSVLQQAANDLVDFQGKGVSIASISHRAPVIEDILAQTNQMIRELYQLPNHFEILWLPGGASTQLQIAPLNLCNSTDSIGFYHTGFWADRAMEAAKNSNPIQILGSAEDQNFGYIPPFYPIPENLAYLHIVSNETIDGIQYHDFPQTKVPIVADMTSDFLSKPLNFDKFGLIFASAQKNFGIAGITCLLVNTKLLGNKDRHIPLIHSYENQIKENSLYHTIPTFPLYVAHLMIKWIKDQGGLLEMQRRNQLKSNLLYQEIERNEFLDTWISKDNRSELNVCFKGINPEIEEDLLTYLSKNNIMGIKGFPTKGGFRASMYHGMDMASAEYLVDLLKNYSK